MNLIDNPHIINLPKIEDERGNLSFFQNNQQIPFKILRTYWIYDVPGGCDRGGHAFKLQKEFIIAISGSFDVFIHTGESTQLFSLNRSFYGLFIPNGHWRQLKNFSTNSLALVVSSTSYNENDYIRNFDEFLSYRSL